MRAKSVKKCCFVLIVCLACALLAACGGQGPVSISVGPDGGSLSGMTFVVDAGHGGFDVGTQGVKTGTPEKDVNLSIAKKLQAVLEEEGASVVMTREDENAVAPTKEEDMQARTDLINEVQPDMMISIHQNRFDDSSVRGPQVFYLKEGTQAEKLARSVQASLNGQLAIEKPRSAITGDYRMLKPGKGPSIIVECGFLSNPDDEALLLDEEYQQRLAEAVVSGVYSYLGMHGEVGV